MTNTQFYSFKYDSLDYDYCEGLPVLGLPPVRKEHCDGEIDQDTVVCLHAALDLLQAKLPSTEWRELYVDLDHPVKLHTSLEKCMATSLIGYEIHNDTARLARLELFDNPSVNVSYLVISVEEMDTKNEVTYNGFCAMGAINHNVFVMVNDLVWFTTESLSCLPQLTTDEGRGTIEEMIHYVKEELAKYES
jgi:hypothetical protein